MHNTNTLTLVHLHIEITLVFGYNGLNKSINYIFLRRTITMIKKVTYFEYQALKAIGKKVRILKADDNSATIVIGK